MKIRACFFSRNSPLETIPFASILLASTILIGCAAVKSGPYEITAYDNQSRPVRSINVLVTDSRSLSVPMNGLCIAYPKSRVVAKPKDGSEAIERQC